jgi:uncharacterized membrane protein
VIYKIYSWTAAKKGDTPIANTILTLAIVHFFQLLTFLLFIDQIVIPLKWLSPLLKTQKGYLFLVVSIYFVAFYFLVYNKQRWDSYVDEFKNESEEQRRKGNIWVISYLIGSILLFFISLPVLFTLSKHLHG